MSNRDWLYGYVQSPFRTEAVRVRYRYLTVIGGQPKSRIFVEAHECVGSMKASRLVGPAEPFTEDEHAALDQFLAERAMKLDALSR